MKAGDMAVAVSPVLSAKKPSRLVLVQPPGDSDLVRVWWHLDRPASRWRCSVHGSRASASCVHMKAAYGAMRDLLLGEEPDR